MKIKSAPKRRFAQSLLCVLVFTLIIDSCTKFVTVDPPTTSLTQTNVYSANSTAVAVLTGLYTTMVSNGSFTGSGSISVLCGLSADELSLWSGVTNVSQLAYYNNALTYTISPSTSLGSDFWSPLYKNIFYCNSAIDGLNSSQSQSLTPAVRQQLLGEAKFMRAFYYFYLVNLFGDVPLVLNLDYAANALLSKTPKAQVYQQIIQDLQDAQTLLSNNFVYSDAVTVTTERTRPTKWAATALLARAYLYEPTPNWVGADSASSAVINNSSLFSLVPLNNVFVKNSNEAILQLQSLATTTPVYISDGLSFIIPTTGFNGNQPFYISNRLLSVFETNDGRKTNWLNTYTSGSSIFYYPYKYKSTSSVTSIPSTLNEYLMILRLGEQYLIRAEARAQENNLSGAASDLNVIRVRASASLPTVIPSTQAAMLSAVAHERQVELFAEWGHRWLDLKRTATIDAAMIAKGVSWNSYQQWYPLPYADINTNPNITQNTGY